MSQRPGGGSMRARRAVWRVAAIGVVLATIAPAVAHAEPPSDVVAVPGAASTTVKATNQSGAVAGEWTDASGVVRGFLYKAGRYTIIDPPGIKASIVIFEVSDDGAVLGRYSDPTVALSRLVGFRYWNGEYTVIDPPESLRTDVFDMPRAGLIVGGWRRTPNRDTPRYGFIWQDGVYTKIELPDVQETVLFDASKSGWVVGWVSNGTESIAIRWRNGELERLNPPGVIDAQASAVAENGTASVSYRGTDNIRHFIEIPAHP